MTQFAPQPMHSPRPQNVWEDVPAWTTHAPSIGTIARDAP